MRIKTERGTTDSGGLPLSPTAAQVLCSSRDTHVYVEARHTRRHSEQTQCQFSFVLCRDLGRAIFGERWGVWAIAPFQWSVLIGLAITYTATAGQSLQVRQRICRPGLHMHLSMHASA